MRITVVLVLLSGLLVCCRNQAKQKLGEPGGAENLTRATAHWQKDPLAEYVYIRSRRQPLIQRLLLTAVHIKEGRAVQRLHYSGRTLDQGGQEKVESWREETPAVSNRRTNAFPALTMEQLFAECQASIQKFPGTAPRITLFASGLLAECTVRPPGCADDCGYELRLEQIRPGALSDGEMKQFLEKGSL
ncbi:MAG: hypothetical protein HS115_16085 [Spirochaetales bacterium]|nr:hypothetical protein [Spirochaetales bacterium]